MWARTGNDSQDGPPWMMTTCRAADGPYGCLPRPCAFRSAKNPGQEAVPSSSATLGPQKGLGIVFSHPQAAEDQLFLRPWLLHLLGDAVQEQEAESARSSSRLGHEGINRRPELFGCINIHQAIETGMVTARHILTWNKAAWPAILLTG